MGEFDPQTEKLLKSSFEQYREILQQAENLLKMMDACDYSQVDEHVIRSQQLQSEASRQDEQLLPLLTLDLPTWEKHTQYQNRLDCIRSIVELNKVLLPKIHGVMAITKAELGNLSGGRNALVGYASQDADKRVFLGIG